MDIPNLSLFFIMACFGVTLWLVNRFLIGPVGAILAERSRRIDGAEKEWTAKNEEYLSATRRLESEIEDASKEAARIREEFRQKAQTDRQQRLETARASAEERLEAALGELDRDAEAARDDLRARAAELGALFAGRLLGREVRS